MNDLILIFDSLGYDAFKRAKAPNLRGVGEVYEGRTHGSWTLPSLMSITQGYIPYVKEVGQPLLKPNMFLQREREGAKCFFLNTNSWMKAVPIPHCETRHYNSYGSLEVVNDALNIVKECESNGTPYTIVILLYETHDSYCARDSAGDVIAREVIVSGDVHEDTKNQQAAICDYLDSVVKPLLDSVHDTRIFFTADHGNMYGVGGVGHNPAYGWSENLFRVPLIVGYRGCAEVNLQ